MLLRKVRENATPPGLADEPHPAPLFEVGRGRLTASQGLAACSVLCPGAW